MRPFIVAVLMFCPLWGYANPLVSSTYQHLIDREWANPFTQAEVVVAELTNGIGKQLASAIEQHITEESQLLEFRELLKRKAAGAGLNPNQIAVSIMERLNDHLQNPQAAGLGELISVANEHAEEFFDILDRQNQDRMDLSIAFSFHGFRLWIAQNIKKMAPEQIKKFHDVYAKLSIQLKLYIENKDQFGQNKDTLRTTPYKKFFVTLQSFAKSQSPSAQKGRSFVESIKNFYNGLVRAVKLSPRAVNVVRQVYFPQNRPGLERPLGSAALGFIRALFSKVEVRIHGRENLPVPDANSKKVYVVVSSHHDGLGDFIAFGEMGRDDMVIYGAPNNFLKIPQVFKDYTIKKLDQNSGFVVVGKGRTEESNPKAIRLVRETGARIILNFSQGRLDEGIGGQAKIRDGIHQLIAGLTEAGFEPYIVGVSLRNTSRLFNGVALSDLSLEKPSLYQSGIDVKVFPAITPKLRESLVELGGVAALNFVLRYGLLEDKDLMEDENVVLGGVRASRLIPLLANFIGDPAEDCVRALTRGL